MCCCFMFQTGCVEQLLHLADADRGGPVPGHCAPVEGLLPRDGGRDPGRTQQQLHPSPTHRGIYIVSIVVSMV